MKELVEIFGHQNHLCGTLCIPEESSLKPGAPCIVMLNSGLIYQAGPCRLHVEMARDIAKLGLYSFRFDLSGIGDSSRSRDNLVFDEQVPVDIDDALAFIETKTGVSSFVLIGNCTGADNAHKHALRCNKVTGAIFLDGYAYKTSGYYIRYYLHRIINPIYVAGWLRRLIFSKLSLPKNPPEAMNINIDVNYWTMPPKEKTIKELTQLIDKNIFQLHIFTSDWEWCFNHQTQFNSMYKDIDFKGLASCVYFSQSDHTYTFIDERLKLIKTVTDWLEASFILPK